LTRACSTSRNTPHRRPYPAALPTPRAQIRRIVVSEQRRFDQPGGATPLAGATPMTGASTSASTPLFAGNATPGPGGSSASSVAGSAVGEAQALPLSLDQFLVSETWGA
jgi:hypothetical protein